MLSILTIKLVITMKMIIHFFKIQNMTMINSLKFKKKKKQRGNLCDIIQEVLYSSNEHY